MSWVTLHVGIITLGVQSATYAYARVPVASSRSGRRDHDESGVSLPGMPRSHRERLRRPELAFSAACQTIKGESRVYVRTAVTLAVKFTSISAPRVSSTVFYTLAHAPELIAIPVGAFRRPSVPKPKHSVTRTGMHSWVVVAQDIEHLHMKCTLPPQPFVSVSDDRRSDIAEMSMSKAMARVDRRAR